MTYVDLHSHTIYSDGDLTPEEVLRRMKEKGIEAGAITDHDAMGGYFKAKEEAKQLGIRLIPGVEVTSPDYHILGLGIDDESEQFKKFLAHSRHVQEDVCARRIERLQEIGMPITLEKVRALYPEARLGKLNILGTMFADPACKEYLQEHTPTLTKEESFKYYLKRQAKIPWIKGAAIDDEIIIREIHAAGGIAVIAHPFKDVKDMKELELLVEKGLDGIEMQPNYGDRNIPFVDFAREKNLLITYGSDYHGDWKKTRPLLGRGINQMDLEKLLFAYK
ncbi:MAG TPA: PHP domain-containing protein [Candidatus Nanoarchaeia archaeon]|nr:PHP domain-containing protein [Candidatus Nanoarchaeia archaeon]